MTSESEKKTVTKQVYLDYNATTPLDTQVLQSIHDALRDAWGNPSSSHSFGQKAYEVIKKSRDSVAQMIGCLDSAEIIFTSGGTEANNLVFHSAFKYYQRVISKSISLIDSKPQLIISNQEHDSVCLPVQHLQSEFGAEKCVVNVARNSGMVTAQDIKDAIKPNTCLVSVMLANNETGVIQVSSIAREW